jgi:hypothetical protein
MRQNQADPSLSLVQPVVSAVPQPDDEPDVTYVGTALYFRLALPLSSQPLLLAA